VIWRRLRRVAALAVGLSVPGFIVLALLAGTGLVGEKPALIAAGGLFVLTCIVAGPHIVALAHLREATDRLAAELAAGADIPAALSPAPALGAERLWRSLNRLVRAWRERLLAVEARREAAEAVIAAVPDPLILIDERRRIVRANAPSLEFIGTAAEPRDLAAGLRNPAVLAAVDAVLRGEAAQIVEFSVALPVERLLRARVSRIAGPALDGAVAILTLHDITALKRAEQMRGDFIANASHELKTPLATLLGFIETLQGPARTDARARDRFLAIMQEQALRMTRLVDDLLSLSRIELNEHVSPTGRVALAPVLRHVADTLELHAEERGMRITLAVPPDLPDIAGDRDELAQVFQNLLDNALKYGRADSDVRVEAGVTKDDGAAGVWVAVKDHGDGIPGAHLPRLTERFYRVDTARSRALGGTGLGLAIVKHIVNRHRGALDIDSTLGVGSVFTVHLRASSGAADGDGSTM
jgi:two-component system phosphate regulon sensor histidine kinase PhoR